MKLVITARQSARIVLLLLCPAFIADLTLSPEPPKAGSSTVIARLLPRRSVDTFGLIHAAAIKHKVPEAFIRSIVAVESNFNAQAVSPKGAIGLMQLMPATARELGADPAVPEQNIDAGTRYLRLLMARYQKYRNGMKRTIAAFNAGPAVVDRFRGVPPYRETRGYVARVLALFKRYQKGARS